jgi:hypothetical protein
LNDFNQVAKKVFKKYSIFPGGIIVCKEDEGCVVKGCHYAFTEKTILDNIPDNMIISLSAEAVFKTIKDRKKEIKYLKLDNHSIYLAGDDIVFLIGSIMPVEDTDNELNQFLIDAKDGIEYCSTSVNIQKSLVEALCNNEIISFDNNNGHKIRITKEIVPGVKDAFDVSVTMVDIPSDKDLFRTYIRVNRDELISYHRYTCVKF